MKKSNPYAGPNGRHFDRHCIIDAGVVEWDKDGNLANHVYASFPEANMAKRAMIEMNRDIRRARVQVIHYRYPYPSEA